MTKCLIECFLPPVFTMSVKTYVYDIKGPKRFQSRLHRMNIRKNNLLPCFLFATLNRGEQERNVNAGHHHKAIGSHIHLLHKRLAPDDYAHRSIRRVPYKFE